MVCGCVCLVVWHNKNYNWGNAATVCGAVGSLPGLWGNFTPSSFTKKDRGAAEHLWSFGVAGGEEPIFIVGNLLFLPIRSEKIACFIGVCDLWRMQSDAVNYRR